MAIPAMYDVSSARKYAKRNYPKEKVMNETCDQCGGAVVMIRGKYPGFEKRKVCPTCLQERMDQISEMSDPSYGKANSELKGEE